MIRPAAAALAAALALAGCASSAPSPPITSPGPLQASIHARAVARVLIDHVKAGDLFEDVSLGDTPRVRHYGSGLVCRFSPEMTSQGLQIYESGLPRGHDVGCQLPTDAPGQFHTLYATRYGAALTLSEAMRSAVGMVRNAYPSLKPYEGPAAAVGIQRDDLRPPPASETARFVIELNGRPHLSRVSVAVVDGWVIKQRFTTPVEDNVEQTAVMSDLLAGLVWSETLLRFSNGDALDRQAPAPPAEPTTRT